MIYVYSAIIVLCLISIVRTLRQIHELRKQIKHED